jgi:hypothetical protein
MDGAFQGYRQLRCGNYWIIYEITHSARIETAYIHHRSRQMGLRLVRG